MRIPSEQTVKLKLPPALDAETLEPINTEDLIVNGELLSSNDPKLPGQFLLTRQRARIPAGYQLFKLDGWHLATDLPTAGIFGPDAAHLGWIIGWAVAPEGRLVKGPVRIADDATPSAIEEFLYRHGGRFAAILLTSGCQRLYLDPAGSLAAVYSWHGTSLTDAPPTAASTTSLLAWSEGREPARSEPTVNGFRPAGLTADPLSRRLLPNHYLDLSSWAAIRHHLSRIPERVNADEIEALVKDVLHFISMNVSAVAVDADAPPALGLTSGRDSRVILAAARPVARNLDLFTFDYPYLPGDPDGTNADQSAASTLARRLGLRHRVLPIRDAGPEVRTEYLHRIGYAGNSGKARDFLQACRDHVDPRQPLYTGFGGKLNWKLLANLPRAWSAEMILRKLKLSANETAVQAMQSWLESFESQDPESLLDLFYLEQRLGCWAGPHTYGFANVFNMSPFTHRRIFDAMLRLPLEYRCAQRLSEDIIRLGWPELAGIPFDIPLDPYSSFRRGLSRLRDRFSHFFFTKG